MITPIDIQALRTERKLKIVWPEQRTSEYPFYDLRCACNCAGCVDENTGQRILNPEKISREVTINKIDLVGNYALRVDWSDGHNTGLYTWEYLAKLAGQSK